MTNSLALFVCKRHSFLPMVLAVFCLLTGFAAQAEEKPKRYLLKPALKSGSCGQVDVRLEVGGEMLVRDEEDEVERLPLKVAGEFSYREQLLVWSPDGKRPARSLRQYENASAEIQVAENSRQRALPDGQRLLLAEIRNGFTTITGLDQPLTRDQWDLVNVVGGSLVIDRLLPGRELAEGDRWDHDAATIGALLGMDHVAVCEVSSVATGERQRQVPLRMAGTVHGTIDGTPTELDVRAAYLFHLDEQRVTKFNLAIKESRSPGEIAPGLDVVAKAFVTVRPHREAITLPEEIKKQVKARQGPLPRILRYQSPNSEFRLEHDANWYPTAEQRDQVSFRYLYDGQLAAHCNVELLPARSAGRHTSLEEFEHDVREALDENLEEVVAAREWETAAGHHCLGVIANGTIKKVPIQWRYYLVAADDRPRVTVGISLEKELVDDFADAERPLIDSLELVAPAATVSQAKERGSTK